MNSNEIHAVKIVSLDRITHIALNALRGTLWITTLFVPNVMTFVLPV